MSVNSTGAGEKESVAIMETLTSGGINVVLIGNSGSVSYTDTNIQSSFTTRAEPVSSGDLTISTPSSFSGKTDLITDVQVGFGSVNIGTVSDVVIQNQSNTDHFVLANEVNNPSTSGQTVTLPSNTTLYSFGNP